MDGQHDGGRQSSLPSSLIPHLYRHPPLRHYDPDANAPLPPLDAPFVPAPALLRAPAAPYAFWSEGEAGPSSLARYRRPDSLSPRPFDVFGRSNPNYDYPDPHFALPQHHSTPLLSIPSHLLISINSPILRVTPSIPSLLGRGSGCQFLVQTRPLPLLSLHHRSLPPHPAPAPSPQLQEPQQPRGQLLPLRVLRRPLQQQRRGPSPRAS